jgi:hypothetical protein
VAPFGRVFFRRRLQLIRVLCGQLSVEEDTSTTRNAFTATRAIGVGAIMAVLVVLGACKRDSVDSRGWSSNRMAAYSETCQEGMGKSVVQANPQGARRACECVVAAVRERWTYADYKARLDSLNKDLQDAGVLAKCRGCMASPPPSASSSQ